jgi:bifunctional DNA-binding transcriptional regulator/antitoxin component of YhaV-PrlF toxin-antitoxin module
LSATPKTFAGRYLRRGNGFVITLPPEVRQRLGLVPGDYLMYLLVGDVLRVRKIHPRLILAGEFEAPPGVINVEEKRD